MMNDRPTRQNDDAVYGIRAIMEAVRSGKQVDKVLVKQGLSGELASELFSLLKQRNIPMQYVPEQSLNKYGNRNHQGVIAMISPVEFHDLEFLLPTIFEQKGSPFLLILDGITDVRNFGAIVRTAECAGVDAIIIPTKGSAKIGSDAVKTSAGALHNVPICKVHSLKVAINFMKQSGLKVISATEKANQTCYESDLTGPVALVMGSEDEGVSNDVIRLSDMLVAIPQYGQIGSLNVSVAAGVLTYEIVRQRIRLR